MYHFPLFSNLILINKLNGLIIFNIFISLQQKCQRICSSKVGFFFFLFLHNMLCVLVQMISTKLSIIKMSQLLEFWLIHVEDIRSIQNYRNYVICMCIIFERSYESTIFSINGVWLLYYYKKKKKEYIRKNALYNK